MMNNDRFYGKDETIRYDAMELAISISELNSAPNTLVARATAIENYIKHGEKQDD